MRCAAFLLLTLFASVSGPAPAQTLRDPSRTVYRCEEAGKVTYSDAPCLGAKKVDVEPTRGLDKSSGRKLTGADVQRERRQEALAEAVKPLTGMDAKELALYQRRMKLSPEARNECLALDRQLRRLESAPPSSDGADDRAEVARKLFAARSRSHELRC